MKWGGVDWFDTHGWFRLFWDNNRLGENPESLNNIIGIPMHHMFPFLTPMWYLRDLMIVCLLSPIVWLVVTKLKTFGLVFVSTLMILNIWIPFEGFSAKAFFFFSWGAYFRINNKSFVECLKRYEFSSYLLVVITVFGGLYYYTTSNMISSIIINVYTIFGMITIVNLAKRIECFSESSSTIKLSETSFFVYASHIMTMGICSFLLSKLLHFNSETGIIIEYFMKTILTIVTSVLVYFFMKNKLPKVLSILNGGR